MMGKEGWSEWNWKLVDTKDCQHMVDSGQEDGGEMKASLVAHVIHRSESKIAIAESDFRKIVRNEDD